MGLGLHRTWNYRKWVMGRYPGLAGLFITIARPVSVKVEKYFLRPVSQGKQASETSFLFALKCPYSQIPSVTQLVNLHCGFKSWPNKIHCDRVKFNVVM